MKYKLEYENTKGIMIDRTPILGDIRDTYAVSFLLPGNGCYIALFIDSDGIEYRKAIFDGKCKIPYELLKKEQYVDLTVCEIIDDEIKHSWVCDPLKISSFMYLRRTQWTISGGMTDKDCLSRLNEIEQLYTKAMKDMWDVKTELCERVAAIETAFSEQKERIENAISKLEKQKETNAVLTQQLLEAKALYEQALEATKTKIL